MRNDDKKLLTICILLLSSLFIFVLLLFIKFVPIEIIYIVGYCIVLAIIYTVLGFLYGLSKAAEAGGRLPHVFKHLYDSFKSLRSKDKY